ncbi:hypothetical protein ACJX0J_013564, partial [Zea mays]
MGILDLFFFLLASSSSSTLYQIASKKTSLFLIIISSPKLYLHYFTTHFSAVLKTLICQLLLSLRSEGNYWAIMYAHACLL